MNDNDSPPPDVLRTIDVFERLAQAPLVEIRGAVDESVGGIRLGGRPRLTAVWMLLPWRVGEGTVSVKPLRVRQEVDDVEFSRLSELMTRGTIVHLRARLIDETDSDQAYALLEAVVATGCEDAALRTAVEELQPFAMFADEQFGAFYREPAGVTVAADVDWNGEEIVLSLPAKKTRIAAAANHARRLWLKSLEWDQRSKEFATAELLPLKNTAWLMPGETPVGASEFSSRLTLQCLEVSDDGELLFLFDDGGMFQEHVVVVRGTIDQGFSAAELAG